MANDPYWNNTVLLLHGDTAGDPNWESATVVEEFTSVSSMVIPAGTPWVGVPGVIGTYFGRPAMYCNGVYPALASIGATGSTAFTIEFDYYTTSFTSAANPLFQTASSAVSPFNSIPGFSLWTDAAGSLGGYFHGTTAASGIATLVPNQWQRISLSYNGATLVNVHVDGVFKMSVTCGIGGSGDIGLTLNYCGLGGTGHNNITGVANYLAHLRIYRGKYGYLYPAANYTPVAVKPLFGLLPDSSKSVARYPVATGSLRAPYVSEFKFGGGCIRCDGASYAELPASTDWNFGTGDFTVEAWVYRQASGIWQAMVGQWNKTTDLAWSMHVGPSNDLCFFTKNSTTDYFLGSGGAHAIPLATWTHCAVVHKAGTRMLFINGQCVGMNQAMAAIATGVSTTVLRVGRAVTVVDPYTGCLDDIRVTKGVARYAPSVTPVAVPNAPFQFTSGETYWGTVVLAMAMNDAPLSDAKGQSVTLSGAVLSAAQSKWGGGAAYFDGSSFLEVAGGAGMAIGTSDFTVEMWVYPSVLGVYAVLFDLRPASTDGAYPAMDIRADGTIGFHMDATTSAVSTEKVVAGAWSHIAACRTGGVTCVFVNGVPGGYSADVRSYLAGSNRPVLGAVGYNTTAQRFTGYIDDLRVSKFCRYVSTFTPPTQALPEGLTTVSGTVTDATGALCARTVNVHSRANGRLLGTAVSDPVTGVYSIGAAEPCYVVVLDSTGDYDALILDRIDPVT